MSDSYTAPVQATVAGGFYVVGPHGDDDPGHALEQVVISNGGTTAIRVGHSLTDIVAGRYIPVAPSTSMPLEGPYDNLIVYNPEAATAASWALTGMCGQGNSGKDGGLRAGRSTPGTATRYTVVRPNRTAGATVATAVAAKYRRLLTGLKVYSVVPATGGTITVDLLTADGVSLLAGAVNAKAPTAKTLYAGTLSSVVSLTVARDLVLSYASSSGGDVLGDILIEIAHEVA